MRLKEAIEKFTEWRSMKIKSFSLRSYDKDLKYFALYFNNCDISQITPNNIAQYFNQMEDLGWNINTIIQKSVSLRKFFEFFHLQGLPVVNPELILLPNRRPSLPKVADQKDFFKLCSTISEDNNIIRSRRNLSIVKFLYSTGVRNGELCSLDINDCNFSRRKAIIRTEKARSRPFREIFWNMDTAKSLERWLSLREKVPPKDDAVFVCLDRRKRGIRIGRNGVSDMLRNWSHSAKINTLNAHSFRHRFGRDCAKSGMNNSSISNLLGHSNIQSSFVYTQLEGKDLHEQWEKVRSQ